MSELKPCPFCGGVPDVTETKIAIGETGKQDDWGNPIFIYGEPFQVVHCPTCGYGQLKHYRLDVWNTRPGEMIAAQNVISSYAPVMDALTAERDALRAELEQAQRERDAWKADAERLAEIVEPYDATSELADTNVWIKQMKAALEAHKKLMEAK